MRPGAPNTPEAGSVVLENINEIETAAEALALCGYAPNLQAALYPHTINGQAVARSQRMREIMATPDDYFSTKTHEEVTTDLERKSSLMEELSKQGWVNSIAVNGDLAEGVVQAIYTTAKAKRINGQKVKLGTRASAYMMAREYSAHFGERF